MQFLKIKLINYLQKNEKRNKKYSMLYYVEYYSTYTILISFNIMFLFYRILRE